MIKRLLLAILLGLGGTAYGQTVGTAKPQAHDNLILVQTSDSATVALRKLAAAFIAQGYTVEKLDKEYLTLELRPKILAVKNSPEVVARATASSGANSQLRLSGNYKAFIGSIPANDVVQMGSSEQGLYSHTFRALEKVALTYPAGKVSYGKQ